MQQEGGLHTVFLGLRLCDGHRRAACQKTPEQHEYARHVPPLNDASMGRTLGCFMAYTTQGNALFQNSRTILMLVTPTMVRA
jgi:hypothetical protein